MVTPNRPSSLICSTTASGNLSSWSCSSAIGITCSSTNWRTISVIARCSSVFSLNGVATAKMGLPDVVDSRVKFTRASAARSRLERRFEDHDRDVAVGLLLVLVVGRPFLGHDRPEPWLLVGCRGTGVGLELLALHLHLHLRIGLEVEVPGRMLG